MTDMIMQLGGVLQREIDTLKDVSQNIANANTPGYKATRPFSAFSAVTAPNSASQGLVSIENQAVVKTDAGTLQITGRATDFAVSGDAWFVVQTPQGPQLTRDGRFHLDNKGQLISQGGYAVLGQDGPLLLDQGVPSVDAAGNITVDNQKVGQFQIVRVTDPQNLVATGGGLYVSTLPAQPAEHYVVRQGMQERSNADLSTDMVKIMELSRHIESVQRALSAYDGMLNSGINQLGKD